MIPVLSKILVHYPKSTLIKSSLLNCQKLKVRKIRIFMKLIVLRNLEYFMLQACFLPFYHFKFTGIDASIVHG